nr:signal peptide peptidase SppA [Spirochaetaceae bacterium]
LLWDVINAIEIAEYDDKINAILFDFRTMRGAGLAALTEIRTSIEQFKSSGKKVISYSDAYNQSQYYLASASDEIYVDPLGDFIITGFAVYNRYYGEGLERLGVDVNYFHAGKYKSYGEVYTRSSMSDEAREENLHWSGDLWSNYVSTVSSSRNLMESQFNKFINSYVELLLESNGNSVKTALNATLVDGLLDRDELRSLMIDISGYSFESDSFNQIQFENYLKLEKGELAVPVKDKIAVIVASGTIYNGYQDPGNIGGDSLVTLLDTVQKDNSYKALVLRVDSGGGSAFTSEIIRRKLEKLRKSGIPVVVSMGSVAASGGYWISTASDEIWAQATTITGSIGVFSLLTSFEDPLKEYLGVTVDGVGTTWLAGSMRSDRNLDPQVGKIFQSSVDHIYSEFLSRVSESRGKSVDDVHKIAQGRVWSGEEALKIGLVDKQGGLSDAINSAGALAGLEEDSFGAVIIQQEIPIGNQIINTILNASISEKIFRDFSLFKMYGEVDVLNKMNDLKELNDPSGVYALSTLMFE